MRLVSVVQEARDLLMEMRALQTKLFDLLKTLPKNAKTEKQEAMKLMEQVAEKIKELRKEANVANQVASHIEGHYKWKNAIKAVFGQEGVDKCIAWMEYDAEQAKADVVDVLDSRTAIA